jgi:hypothetical protein
MSENAPVVPTVRPPGEPVSQALGLLGDRNLRLAAAALATTEYFARPGSESWTADGHAETFDELWQMQAAVRERFLALQQSWADGWFKWLRYAADLGGANTLSKFAEREYNIAAQAVQLVGAQSEGLLGLVENVEIGYLYWIRRKLQSGD